MTMDEMPNFFFLRKSGNSSIEKKNQYRVWKLALVEQTPSRLQKAYFDELFWRASGPLHCLCVLYAKTEPIVGSEQFV
jgi:hypothetical protein